MFKKLLNFEWDRGNFNKNWLRHKITNEECEEAFFDQNRKIFKDLLHSKGETRFTLLGKTKQAKLLFISFARRKSKVRVISARRLNKKQERIYYK
jgi:uncharacterized protein